MPWTLVGQSVTGTSHHSNNTPCQDAFRYKCFGDWLVVAVADGAGSASHSEVGASRACEEFVQRAEVAGICFENIWKLFGDVRAVLLTEAKRLDVRPRELACTALLVIAGPESVIVAQLGDGGVVLGDGEKHIIAFWPEPTEYANATDFLTDDCFADALKCEVFPGPIKEIAIFTDGLQRLALDFSTKEPHPPFFSPLFKTVGEASDIESLAQPLREFLDSPKINNKTDDDKTLVIAISRP